MIDFLATGTQLGIVLLAYGTLRPWIRSGQ
jgi:hypothetical protein